VVERYRYDVYGQRTVLAADGVTVRAQSNYGQQIGFTGRYLDNETGLWYFRARYYSGTLGRFASRDPLQYIDGTNLYYAFYIPNHLDPTGLVKNGEECSSPGEEIYNPSTISNWNVFWFPGPKTPGKEVVSALGALINGIFGTGARILRPTALFTREKWELWHYVYTREKKTPVYKCCCTKSSSTGYAWWRMGYNIDTEMSQILDLGEGFTGDDPAGGVVLPDEKESGIPSTDRQQQVVIPPPKNIENSLELNVIGTREERASSKCNSKGVWN